MLLVMDPRSPSRLVSVLAEETTLFASVLKWTVLATLVGMLAGAATAFFLWILNASVAQMQSAPARLLWLPPGFVGAYLLVRFLAPDAEGHGTDKVIEAVHRQSGRIPPAVAPVKLVATVLTIATGGSVGKEGPAAQIGATLASMLASLLRLQPHDRRKLVICGIGGGFASIFGTPIAGAVFGLEVLVLGSVMYDVIYPAFVSGIVAHHVASRLGVTYFQQALYDLPRQTEGIFLKTIAAGVLFGLVALLLIEAMRLCHHLVDRIPAPGWVVAGGGGALLAALGWIFSDRYLGLGIPTIEASVRGAWVPPQAFLLKIVFTAISLAVGGSGGIITPTFFIGASAGSALAGVLGFDRGTSAAIGMVALLAGAANAPLAGAIMSIELFGPAVAPFAAIACIVSFVIVGHRSVYPSQILGVAKTRSLRVPRGVDIGSFEGAPVPRPSSSLLRWLLRLLAARRRAGPTAPEPPAAALASNVPGATAGRPALGATGPGASPTNGAAQEARTRGAEDQRP
jgi:H+/Cl- antiporter ClcA